MNLSPILKSISTSPFFKSATTAAGALLIGALDQWVATLASSPAISATSAPAAAVAGLLIHNYLSGLRDRLLTNGDPAALLAVAGAVVPTPSPVADPPH